MIEFGEECNVRRHWCLRILRQFFDAVSQTVEHQPEPHRPSLFLIKSLPDSCLIIPKAILGGGERDLDERAKGQCPPRLCRTACRPRRAAVAAVCGRTSAHAAGHGELTMTCRDGRFRFVSRFAHWRG